MKKTILGPLILVFMCFLVVLTSGCFAQAADTTLSEFGIPAVSRIAPGLRDIDEVLDLNEGFLGRRWGTRPNAFKGDRYLADIAPGLTVFSSDLNVSPVMGAVHGYASPRLVFSTDSGLALVHIDFEYKEYDIVLRQLVQLLGEPRPIIYELWAARVDFSEHSEWLIGRNTRVVLAVKGTTASLEIGKQDFALSSGGSFEQRLAVALLERAQAYDRQNMVYEASSVYQTLLNSTWSYSFFTNTAEEHLAAYSRRTEAVDYLSEDRGLQFYRLKNIFTDSIEQQWVRIDFSAGAQAELQRQRTTDVDSTDGLANISTVLCRVKVDSDAAKFTVVEQIWLDASNQIIGSRPAWVPQDIGWPALYIRQACEEFLIGWFSLAVEPLPQCRQQRPMADDPRVVI